MPLDIWSILIIAVKVINYTSIFLSAGAVLFGLVLRPKIPLVPRAIFLSAIIVGILSSLLLVPLNVGLLNGDGISGMFDIELYKLVDDGPLGQSNQTKIAGLCLLLVATFTPHKLALIANILGVGLIICSFGQVGHAQEFEFYLGQALIAIHMLAVTFWIGSFLPLYRAASGLVTLQETADLAHRFGQKAIIIVPVLMMIGGLFAFLLLGSLGALISSTYGQILLIKIAIVCGILFFAATNKLRIVPAMLDGDKSAAARLQKSIYFEAGLAFFVLVITASLTTVISLY